MLSCRDVRGTAQLLYGVRTVNRAAMRRLEKLMWCFSRRLSVPSCSWTRLPEIRFFLWGRVEEERPVHFCILQIKRTKGNVTWADAVVFGGFYLLRRTAGLSVSAFDMIVNFLLLWFDICFSFLLRKVGKKSTQNTFYVLILRLIACWKRKKISVRSLFDFSF